MLVVIATAYYSHAKKVEPMKECFLKHLRMKTARMKEGKETEEGKQEKIEMERRGYEIEKSQSPATARPIIPPGSLVPA